MVRRRFLAMDVVVEVDGWIVIKRYVEARVGLSVVPELYLTEWDRVSRSPFDHYFTDRRYGVLMRRDGRPSASVDRFIELFDPSFPSSSW